MYIREMKVNYKLKKCKKGECKHYLKKCSSPEEVVKNFFNDLAVEGIEKFVVIYMNSRNEIIYSEICSGGINTCAPSINEIVRRALLCNTTGIILLHNHPSGSVDPSEDDLVFTRRLSVACKIVELNLLDHIIIGTDLHTGIPLTFSFNREKLIKEIDEKELW